MTSRGVSVLEGRAKLYGGSLLLRDVRFQLTREPTGTGLLGGVGSLGPLSGTMDVGDMAEAVVLAGVDDLALEFEDGRRLAIELRSTSGRFDVLGVAPLPEGLREFAARYTTAWCSQDPARVARFFAADGSLTVNDGAPAAGREAIASVARGFMTAFPDLLVMMDAVTPEGMAASYRWTLTGTHAAAGGIPRHVRISGVEQWRFSPEGLIAESRGSFDAAEYQRQLAI